MLIILTDERALPANSILPGNSRLCSQTLSSACANEADYAHHEKDCSNTELQHVPLLDRDWLRFQRKASIEVFNDCRDGGNGSPQRNKQP